MNYPKAIVVCVAMICATVLVMQLVASNTAIAQPARAGAFEGVPAGPSSVYIVNTRTGQVRFCAGQGTSPMTCGKYSD